MKPDVHVDIACEVLEALTSYGVVDYCVAPGGRTAALVAHLKRAPHLNSFYFHDERCAAFFALGKSRQSQRPVAIVVTSGTAVAHLLPAAMEAYYTSVPLVLLTADRPRRFRGSNAPQSCEQLGIFGCYAPCSLDLEEGEVISLAHWDRRRPLHLNLCLEEPQDQLLAKEARLKRVSEIPHARFADEQQLAKTGEALDGFLKSCQKPFVIVSTLAAEARAATLQFLLKLGAPVYLEAISGLREERALRPLCIHVVDKLWRRAEQAGYAIDGILRIGGIPTPRFWRDLEEREGKIKVFSLSENPFSGLSWGAVASVFLGDFFDQYEPSRCYLSKNLIEWRAQDQMAEERLHHLYQKEPLAEPSLIHALSKLIPEKANLFLGQSLPIRTWDLAACYQNPHAQVFASRGLNGIDGQLSTFFGLSAEQSDNWAILGDLTALHDLGGWWILRQLPPHSLKVVVVNNGGGMLFSRMFSDPETQNRHSFGFEAVGKLWQVPHVRWEQIPPQMPAENQLLMELCPNAQATDRFWRNWE